MEKIFTLIKSEWKNFHSRVFFFNLFFQAKRDPYRFRFPLELRFVHPNIDHMMCVTHMSFFPFSYPVKFDIGSVLKWSWLLYVC